MWYDAMGPQIPGAGFQIRATVSASIKPLRLGVRRSGDLDQGRVQVAEYGKLGDRLELLSAKNASCSERYWL